LLIVTVDFRLLEILMNLYINLWEVGKQLRVSCCGDEDDVVKEIERMEARDLEVMKKYEEGNKGSFL